MAALNWEHCLLHGVPEHWAREAPDAVALIGHDRGNRLSWREFHEGARRAARGLLRLGFRKGDFLAASLPFHTDQVLVEYACFETGVVYAPLDLRLKPAEVIACLGQIRPRGYAFPGVFRGVDFGALGAAVARACPFVEHLIRPDDLQALCTTTATAELPTVAPHDGALVIFTTGSTGAPKPALLSHRNILCQNFCLGHAFGFDRDTRLLVNLPPSHVGGQTEALMTTLFMGGAAILLEAFDPARSLEAVALHRANLLGQIPAMFSFEWRLSGYGQYDLGSLEAVICGGQQVPRAFLEKMAAMAPRIGTGLGLTETAGFCTYTRPGATVDELMDGIGHPAPLYPMSIRGPMREDGSAGEELPDGETGHICFRGPQTFLGYVNDPASTARTISTEGWLYTGDLGYRDARGLHFSGRAKWVIRSRGYQVFPAEIENHLSALADLVAQAGVVAAPHAIHSEGIVAFIEKKPGAELELAVLKRHARGMAAYMRPLHYVLLEPGQMPLNRVAKIDYVLLEAMARAEVERLRARRRWDR